MNLTDNDFKNNIDPNHINAEVIADSDYMGKRLTTLKIRVPRIILAEFNTHRVMSRNFESSRAVPNWKLRKKVLDNPFVPIYWGANKSGMSASEVLSPSKEWLCRKVWIVLSKLAVFAHWTMEKIGLHKQTCNRVLEPWLSVSGVVTSTEWDNFFKLRCHWAAQPEMQALAYCIKRAMEESTPKVMTREDIHLPFIDDEERSKFTKDELIKISVARVCRTSYNNNYGAKSNPEEDIKLYGRLLENWHMSPFESVAVPIVDGIDEIYHNRNFRGWASIRSFLEPENRLALLKTHYDINLS